MQCVPTVSYSFLINGNPQGLVIPTRGLRQGDPLSPYLFILYTEVVSGMGRLAQEEETLPGVLVARQSPYVNHLLFADDTMISASQIKSTAILYLVSYDTMKKPRVSSSTSINHPLRLLPKRLNLVETE